MQLAEIPTTTQTLSKVYRKVQGPRTSLNKADPMPSSSKKQHRFMEAVAHGMKPRKGGPSAAVAKDFVEADKGRDFRGMKNGKKDEGPGELEEAEDTREIDAFKTSVKKRSAKIHNRRKK